MENLDVNDVDFFKKCSALAEKFIPFTEVKNVQDSGNVAFKLSQKRCSIFEEQNKETGHFDVTFKCGSEVRDCYVFQICYRIHFPSPDPKLYVILSFMRIPRFRLYDSCWASFRVF